MKKVNGKAITLIILILSAIMLMPGCAASKKNAYRNVRKNSYIDLSQLGRNKYFFSKQYQKKLYRFKKK
ncbi:MAG: hypothetical protein QUS66_05665 [Bacteroidota bacterium]|jgi:hypothetical protein|nr:hypothetical protein [Bacteroidota bacterium]